VTFSRFFFNPPLIAEVGVDVEQPIDQKLYIGFSIELPRLTCDRFGVDIMDSSGSSTFFFPAVLSLADRLIGNLYLEVTSQIQKLPLGATGCVVNGDLYVHRVHFDEETVTQIRNMLFMCVIFRRLREC
jgi:hypothetical protein